MASSGVLGLIFTCSIFFKGLHDSSNLYLLSMHLLSASCYTHMVATWRRKQTKLSHLSDLLLLFM
jgi:hypothetical protein